MIHSACPPILTETIALVLLLPASTNAATPGKPVEAGKFPGYVIVPLGRSEGNHLVIPTVIGPRQVQFIVDTGAPQSVIDAGVAQKLQLSPPPPSSGLPAKVTVADNCGMS